MSHVGHTRVDHCRELSGSSAVHNPQHTQQLNPINATGQWLASDSLDMTLQAHLINQSHSAGNG